MKIDFVHSENRTHDAKFRLFFSTFQQITFSEKSSFFGLAGCWIWFCLLSRRVDRATARLKTTKLRPTWWVPTPFRRTHLGGAGKPTCARGAPPVAPIPHPTQSIRLSIKFETSKVFASCQKKPVLADMDLSLDFFSNIMFHIYLISGKKERHDIILKPYLYRLGGVSSPIKSVWE